MFMIEMKGKKALITGASGGIGEAIATRLAEMGVEVLIHYHIQADAAESVADNIKRKGGYADIVQADLSDAKQAIAAWLIRRGQMLDGY